MLAILGKVVILLTNNQGNGLHAYEHSLLNPNPTGLFEGVESTGGGLIWPPLQISAADRAIAAKICTKIETNVLYKTV